MLYLLALLVPPIACIGAGKFWHAVLNFVMCSTLFLWPFAIIHAWVVVRGVKNSSGTSIVINNRC